MHENLGEDDIEDILDVEFDLMHFEEGEWEILANDIVDIENKPYMDLEDMFDFNDVLKFLDDL